MYSNEDLNRAVDQGIFSKTSVEEFRGFMANSQNTANVDEENFRLITGFNDIFVVVASILFLASSTWILSRHDKTLAFSAHVLFSWGLAEYFVAKRRMALPGIILLGSFILGFFGLVFSLRDLSTTPPDNDWMLSLAGVVTVVATYFHWRRFKIPITVAAGAGALAIAITASIATGLELEKFQILNVVLCCGLAGFAFAMFWDASDRTRTTRRSDVAFWLHLLSAPLIVHPVFTNLGILSNNPSMGAAITVIFLYLLMTLISIVIDRRAFMVSSLIYVVYAFSNLFENYGAVNTKFAITGVILGGSLLLLAVFWQKSRRLLIQMAPTPIRSYVPQVR